MLRRRDTASSPRSRLVSHRANRSLAVPLRLLLARVALPRPSIRCVFLRSICARRCPICSLNLAHDRFAVPRIDMLYTTLSCLTLSNLIDSNSLDTIMFASLPLPLQNRLTVWGFMTEYAHENEAFVGACDCLHARDRCAEFSLVWL